TSVPWLRVQGGHPDSLLNVELLCSRLLSALADPGEQHRGEDPAPLGIAQAPDRRAGRDGTVHLDDAARARDSGSGGVPLPLILDGGQRGLPDWIADFFHDCAQLGRSTGAAGAEGVGAAAPSPPPLNGGGCSTGFQSFLSGVITPARTFL